MSKGAVLSLKITGDAKDGIRALDDFEGKAGGLGSSLGKLAGVAAGAFAVDKVLDFGKAAFDAASDLEQMRGSVDAVFGSLGDTRVQMAKFSLAAQDSVGLSERAYDQVASVIGSQLKNAGVPMDQLAQKTNNLIQQGADMSAVFGGTAADAVDALSSVLKGEFDPIEKYGVSLNQSAINAELASRGQGKLTGAALKQAQVQAALDIVTKQTAQTQGQFAAQGDTAAEKAQKLSAWFDNLKSSIGSYLLPIFTTLVGFIQQKVAPLFEKLTSDTGFLGNLFGRVADFISGSVVPAITSLWNELAPKLVPILKDLGDFINNIVIPAFTGIYSFISTYVVPIFSKVLGPALSGIHSAFKTVTGAIAEHKDSFIGLYNSIKPFLDFIRDKVAPFVGGAFKVAFEVVGKTIGVVVTAISKVVDAIKWLLDKGAAVGHFLGKLFGAPSGGGGGATRGAGVFGASRGATSARLLSASSLGGVGAGPAGPAAGSLDVGATNVYITVQGALDPLSVARQVRDLLDTYTARTGGSVAVRTA